MLVQSFLGRLSELEKQIKHGVLPKEEAAVQAYKQQLEVRLCSPGKIFFPSWGLSGHSSASGRDDGVRGLATP